MLQSFLFLPPFFSFFCVVFVFYMSLHSTAMRVSSLVCVCVYFVIYATPTLIHTRAPLLTAAAAAAPDCEAFVARKTTQKGNQCVHVCVCVLDICFVDNMCYCYCYCCCCCCWYSIGKFQTHSTATTHMFKFPACTTMTTLCSSPFPSLSISLSVPLSVPQHPNLSIVWSSLLLLLLCSLWHCKC